MKSQLIRLAMLGAVTMSIAACSMEQAKSGGEDQAAFEQLYQQAEDAYKKASASDNTWTTTEEHLKNAKEAAAKGDLATATKLVKRAKFESDMAYEQYESQKNAGPYLF